MSEAGTPSEVLHGELADLIATGARHASDVKWEEVDKFIGPVVRYLDRLIEKGDCFIYRKRETDDTMILVLMDEAEEVWASNPIKIDPKLDE